MRTRCVLKHALLLLLSLVCSPALPDPDTPSATNNNSLMPPKVETTAGSESRRGPNGEVLLYDGPMRPLDSVFVLTIERPSKLRRVDGAAVTATGPQYHLLPGPHTIEIHVRHPDLSIGSPTGAFFNQNTDMETSFIAVAGHAAILVLKVGPGIVKAVLRDAIASAIGRFDGVWKGSIACNECADCEDLTRKMLEINVNNGRFEMFLNESHHGVGLINDDDNMMVRRKGSGVFSFFGRYDGSTFKLRGHVGSKQCDISFAR